MKQKKVVQQFKYSLVAGLVIMGLGACQSAHDQERDSKRPSSAVESDEAKMKSELRKRQQQNVMRKERKEMRAAHEAEMIVVTGSRVSRADTNLAPQKVMMPAPRNPASYSDVNREQ